ncbi:MAG: c-type cytochrome [Cyclobacteriaceae bacterium]|nr:c-type cytochrome [Cyclobacteriaceae bacterium]UYN86305.1 MAG: c-type cytochrome [Cyclobacteriaceae bacterium]
MSKPNSSSDATLVKLTATLVTLILVMVMLVVAMVGSLFFAPEVTAWFSTDREAIKPKLTTTNGSTIPDLWRAPDESTIPGDEAGDLIRYGKELIAHTAEYLGPNGKVAAMSNGMNCQNCHLDAGTKPFGNNYSAVASTYPKYRPRSGTEETIEKRVNDCFERSLNGSALDNDSKEMKAIVAYINWLGKNVPKGESPKGSGLVELIYLDRAASPENGKVVYEQKCVVCHGATGEGILNREGTAWTYPPLWGAKSYNLGAGLYRISRFAGYVKANMPLGATYNEPQLTDEEAWDVAAYVNSLHHPVKDLSNDWPDISKKPIDHPFGPFHDDFPEEQHKYGPFKPIVEKRKMLNKAVASK